MPLVVSFTDTMTGAGLVISETEVAGTLELPELFPLEFDEHPKASNDVKTNMAMATKLPIFTCTCDIWL